MADPRKIALADVTGPIAAANPAGKQVAREALGLGAAELEGAFDEPFGEGDGVYSRIAGIKGMMGGFSLDAASIFDVQSGQADRAPGAELALYDLFTHIRTGAIVANVATLDWSTDADSRPSITVFEAAASFTLVLPTLPTELRDNGARVYRQQVFVRNVGVPTITVTPGAAAAGRIPLRGSAPTVDFGDWAVMTIEYATPLGFATVTMQSLGASVPPFSTKLASNRGTSGGGISLSAANFNPHIYPADEVLVFLTRDSGTSITLPAGKPWAYVNGGGGLDANGMVANGTSNGSRLARAVGHAEQDVSGSGTFSGATGLSMVAYRGLDIDSWGGLAGTDNMVEWAGYTGVPDGGFAVCYTSVNSSSAVIPLGSVAVHANGEAAVSPGGWRNTTRRVDPVDGVIAIAPVTMGAAVPWHTITVLMVPES